MKNLHYLLTILLVVGSLGIGVSQDSLWTRDYELKMYNQFDLRNSADNGITAHRILHDVYRKEIKPKMGKTLGNISYDIYSFAATYMAMIWPHEFGHSLRAKQAGGHFKIHNARIPVPYTTMHLPEDISLVDEALSVTGGFEVNYLSVRKLQGEFIRRNGAYNEDLSLAFVHRMMYPVYASLIVRVDPENPDTWINTAGDPVHCVLPVFKNYADGKVFLQDGEVNPELVNFYNQSVIFASFFQLLDPQFYKEAMASFGSGDKIRRPTFLIGNHQNGWTYGTLFNTSPLGYELYLNNYVHLNGHQFSIYGKYGKPFKNNGIGISWHNALQTGKLNLSAHVDLWDQDIFGKGVGAEVMFNYELIEKIGMQVNLGYKTEGYVLGKQINPGINLGLGIVYRGDYY